MFSILFPKWAFVIVDILFSSVGISGYAKYLKCSLIKYIDMKYDFYNFVCLTC